MKNCLLFPAMKFCSSRISINIAMEIIKAGIFIVAGGGAGYAIGYRRGQNSGTE